MIRTRYKIVCMLAALVALSGNRSAAADGGAVLSPVKRQEVLEQAKKFLAARNASVVTTDPFHSERFSEMVSGVSRVPGTVAPAVPAPSARTDRDTLQAIASNLKPSGNFIMNGQATLVFGQKRVKAGGFLTIPFEGTEYTLEITAIERTSFTLRLNREEFTRPIK